MHGHVEHAEMSGAGVSPDPEVDPVTAARAVLARHEQDARDRCAQEIGEVLARHGFDLKASPAQILLVRNE